MVSTHLLSLCSAEHVRPPFPLGTPATQACILPCQISLCLCVFFGLMCAKCKTAAPLLMGLSFNFEFTDQMMLPLSDDAATDKI